MISTHLQHWLHLAVAFRLRCAGAEVPEPLVTAEEDSSDLVFLNNTLTEAMLVVFNVADGSVLGSGFSATYSRVHQGLASVTIPSCSAHASIPIRIASQLLMLSTYTLLLHLCTTGVEGSKWLHGHTDPYFRRH